MNKLHIKSALALFFLLSLVVNAQNIPTDYYKNAEGLKKAALKTALHHIIKDADELGYGSGSGKTWSGFCQVDVDAEGYYVDMYSTNRVRKNGMGAGSGMNIEHSFAKSWWGRIKNQAYKDIQQLRPSNSRANSAKGSWPMAVVDGKTTYSNGAIKVGKSSSRPGGEIMAWEPSDEYKGDFARIYMYMVTCYENFDQLWKGNSVNQLDNNTYPVFEDWTTQLLLKWTREDPVSEWEITRNDKVYGIQGNRNPFVDYPELAEYIWGNKMEQAWYPVGGTDPIILSPNDGEVVEMGMTKLNESLEHTLLIKARNLEENLTLTLTGQGYSTTVASLTPEQSKAGQNITITFNASEALTSEGRLTLTSGELSSSVTFHAKSVEFIPVFNVALNDGDLIFFAEPDATSAVKHLTVSTEDIQNEISIEVGTPFEISLDEVDWTSTLTMPATGGELTVRMPVSSVERADIATLTMTCADLLSPVTYPVKGNVQAPVAFFEDFEKGSKSSYSKGQVTSTMGAWEICDGGMWGSSSDPHHDGQSVRMGRDMSSGSYLESKFDKTNGAGVLSFYAGKYGNDSNASFKVMYSTSQGQNWQQVGQEELTSNTLKQFTYTINEVNPIRIRIEKLSGKRFNIDDITISDYKGTGVETVATTMFEARGGKGEITLISTQSQRIAIYNVSGILIVQRYITPGKQTLSLPSGIYFVRNAEIVAKVWVR
jgi:endonuclease I